MKNRLLLHLKHDPALELAADPIRSVPLCSPPPALPQTLSCSHSGTVLIKLSNTQSSVLLLIKWECVYEPEGERLGAEFVGLSKRKGEAGRRW